MVWQQMYPYNGNFYGRNDGFYIETIALQLTTERLRVTSMNMCKILKAAIIVTYMT